MSEWTIEAAGLSKTYADGTMALQDLDLRVGAGRVYGLLGRNGAGKSTLMKLLMGLLRADSGQARVLGLDMWWAPAEDRARVAMVQQDPVLFDWMTGSELRAHVASMYPCWDRDLADSLTGRFELTGLLERPVAALSGGQRRLLVVLVALAARTEVLLLDEPAAMLDPIARRALLDALVEMIDAGSGPTLLYSSHLVGDVERLADGIGILHHGRLRLELPVGELHERYRRVQAVFEASVPDGFSMPGCLTTRRDGRVFEALMGLDADETALRARFPAGARVDLFPIDLEELFVSVAGPTTTSEGIGS